MAPRAITSAIITAACLATGLGACADSSISKPELRLPTAFEASQTGTGVPPAVLDRWWTSFNDPQLEGLIEAALVSAPDARTALARVEEARALRSTRYRGLLPKGDLQGSVTHQETNQQVIGGGFAGFNVPGGLDAASAQFNASWELDVFGRARTGRRVADSDLLAAQFNAEAARSLLAADVGRALFQARSAAIQLADAQETVRIARELARVSGIRAERGLASGGDAARVRADREQAEAEIIRLEAAVKTAKRSLLVLVGRGADPLDSLPVEAVAQPAPDLPPTAPADLLARRPDVREAEARVRVAADTAKLAGLALLPTFNLTGSASYNRNRGAFDVNTSVWSAGVNALLPVLDRPRLLAALRGDRARGEQAVIAFEKAVQTAYGDAENAMTLLEADKARTERLTSAESEARYAYNASNRGYQAGLTDLTTLLEVERTWRAAQTGLTAARTQALLDAVTAFQALGGGWNSSELNTADRRP